MRALLIGGGIAGPVLGMFLRRAGVEALIYEARPSADASEGAYLGVAPNGMNVLEQLGLRRAIELAGAPSLGFRFENARGAKVGAIDGREDVSKYGAPMVMIKRGELQRALLEEAQREGVSVRCGKQLVGIEDSDTHVTATFSDGSQERADVLIGCDGLRSRTRRLTFPGAPEPEFTGLVGLGGYAPYQGNEPLTRGWNTMVFGKRAFFGAFLGARDEVWWFHNIGQDEPGETSAPEQVQSRLLEAHQDDPAWIRDIIARTPQIVGPWPVHDIRSLPAWHRGRVCLIGDAAHATSPSGGQGASLALEDALQLARDLRDQPTPTSAFSAFEHARRARVEEIVKLSRRSGSGKSPESQVAAWFRDRMLSTFLKLAASAQHRAFSYRASFLEESRPVIANRDG